MARVQRKKSPSYNKFVKLLEDLDGKKTSVGFFPTAKYPNGIPVAYVAAIQEFGYAPLNIPPRSFLRTTIAEKEAVWKDLVAKGLASGQSAEEVMDLLGLKAVGDVKEKIISIQEPPLKDSTIKARQNKLANGKTVGNLTKPLVETGIMLKSVQHEVS